MQIADMYPFHNLYNSYFGKVLFIPYHKIGALLKRQLWHLLLLSGKVGTFYSRIMRAQTLANLL